MVFDDSERLPTVAKSSEAQKWHKDLVFESSQLFGRLEGPHKLEVSGSNLLASNQDPGLSQKPDAQSTGTILKRAFAA